MKIDTTYKRAVRIIGKPGRTDGKHIMVYDAVTEEELTNIVAADIHLHATGTNTVKLTFYATNEHGKFTTNKHHEPIIGETTMSSDDHEIDITAYEL